MSSPARQLRNSPYGWWQPARFPRPAGLLSQNCQISGSGAEEKAISCTTRGGVAEPAPGKRPPLWGSGGGDWSAGAPRSQSPGIFGSFHPWKEHEKERSAAPAAGSFANGGKGTKTPCFRPLWQKSSFRRANPEWLSTPLPGHWALMRQRFKRAALTGAAWLVPCFWLKKKWRADILIGPQKKKNEVFQKAFCLLFLEKVREWRDYAKRRSENPY